MFENVLNCASFALSNGLTVALHPDRRLPLVAVDLWYRVGSRDDPRGRTGFAHLFEHLMFMGTPRVPGDGFDKLLEAHGGSNNASTSQDRTAFVSWGPSGLLRTLLWLEADRMRDLGRTLDQERLDLQREVVRNERRQSYEMRPYGHTWLELGSLIYPIGHPYRHPVIGSHEDLAATTVDDIRQFFDTHYVPGNATRVGGGDFEVDGTRAFVEELFSSIPVRPVPSRPATAAYRLESSVERTLEDDVATPRTVLAWTSPARFGNGDAEMDLLADLLTEGAASRLEQALIHQESLVQDVEASQVHGELGSEFVVEATALPGVAIERIEEVISRELERLSKDGPTSSEVERLLTLTEVDFVRSGQELLERTDDINLYLALAGEPDRLAWDFARYQAVTADSLRHHTRTVLDPNRRARLRIVPGERVRTAATNRRRDSDLEHAPGDPEVPEAVAPLAPEPWSAAVPEILTPRGWHLDTHRAELAVVRALLPYGAERDALGEEGRCALACELMSEAADGNDAEALDDALDHLGADLTISPGRSSLVVGVSTLARNLEPALDILADILHRPDLEPDDFERVQEITLGEIAQRDRQPDHVAAIVANRHLMEAYVGQGHPLLGSEASVAPLTLDQLVATHGQIASSASAARWVSAGTVPGNRVADLVADRLGFEPRSTLHELPRLPEPSADGPLDVLLVDRPDAPQTVIRFLRRGPHLGSPDLAATELANAVLGGAFMSRLNRNLRERHGFTYGASSSLWCGARNGFVGAATSVDREVTARATRELLRELDRLAIEPPTEEERASALAIERAERVRGMENVSDVVASLLPWIEAGLPADAAARHLEALRAVTIDDMSEAASRRLGPRAGVLVLVGDVSGFEKDLADVVPSVPRMVT